ncbi:hypothetical protein GQ43DRAFT_466793 [Delitschia confertaspora ATCC 74209]|uniref:Uncharacterized protein n=1 Tax=Delitschia confertaspora ATCC 74209 TaxID=1513339 RepID=A0A9P4JCS6_9PLEO|nr:hypothetical protein GQ43DRAFT_466793 [Delitschia confertaspora ATCC 74209]
MREMHPHRQPMRAMNYSSSRLRTQRDSRIEWLCGKFESMQRTIIWERTARILRLVAGNDAVTERISDLLSKEDAPRIFQGGRNDRKSYKGKGRRQRQKSDDLVMTEASSAVIEETSDILSKEDAYRIFQGGLGEEGTLVSLQTNLKNQVIAPAKGDSGVELEAVVDGVPSQPDLENLVTMPVGERFDDDGHSDILTNVRSIPYRRPSGLAGGFNSGRLWFEGYVGYKVDRYPLPAEQYPKPSYSSITQPNNVSSGNTGREKQFSSGGQQVYQVPMGNMSYWAFNLNPCRGKDPKPGLVPAKCSLLIFQFHIVFDNNNSVAIDPNGIVKSHNICHGYEYICQNTAEIDIHMQCISEAILHGLKNPNLGREQRNVL